MTAGLLRTPLVEVHLALGAKMVPFCGWLMPLQYDSILAEHQQTRSAAGLFDLSHMGRLTIAGPEAARLLQFATTNDVERLNGGAALYTLLCNEHGGVVEDLLVYRFPDEWRLVVNAANRDRVVAHLLALRDQLECPASVADETADTALIGLQGPSSQEVLQPLCASDLASLRYYHVLETELALTASALTRSQPTASASAGLSQRERRDGISAVVSRTGYTGEDGFEIVIEAGEAGALWERLLQDERVRPVGLGARDTLRLEAGMALYGHELGEDVNPYQAGLGRVVKLGKGEFVGRGALAKLAQDPPERKLAGLLFEPGPVPRQGNAVLHDEQAVGAIASGTFSPSLRRPIATAFVRPEFAEPGTDLGVSVRDTRVPARVVSLPFVPHRTRARSG